MSNPIEKEILKQLVNARMLLSSQNLAHRKPLYDQKKDIDKAICKALGLDYYETPVERYEAILQGVLNET